MVMAALTTSCWDSTLEAATNHVDVVQSQAPLSINKNPNLKVSVAALIEDANATVVVVSVDNKDTARAAVWVPISVKLKDASGKVVASNTAAGNDESLTHFPSLPPGGTAYFVGRPVPAGTGSDRTRPSRSVARSCSLDHPLPTITVTKVDTTDIGGGLDPVQRDGHERL